MRTIVYGLEIGWLAVALFFLATAWRHRREWWDGFREDVRHARRQERR